MVERLVAALVLVTLLAGCASQPPAPVIDRDGTARPANTATPPPRPATSNPSPSTLPAPSGSGEAVQQGIPLPDLVPQPAANNPASGAQVDRSATATLLAESRTARRSGDDARAVEVIERAIRLNATQPELWLELADIHLANGRNGEAENCARKALQFGGQQPGIAAEANDLIRRARGTGAG